MSIRRAPPTRTSSSQTGAVKPSGGNQRASCFGSVHALYTRSGGASKTRVVTRVRSGAITLFPVAMPSVLPLQFAQMRVQAIETVLPKDAIALHPPRCLTEPSCLQSGGSPLRVPSARDEPGVFEHLQVLGDRGKRHVKRLRELSDGGVPRRQPGEDRTAGRIGDRPERRAQGVGRQAFAIPLG